jgi:chaperonin GroES
MNIQPLGDQVLIEPLKQEVKKGGIILPDTIAKERPEQGRVAAVGKSTLVKKGDVVIFEKYGRGDQNVTPIKIDDKEYYFVSEGSILAIIKQK